MQILAALALIGILVFIHEFGHFIVARAFGVGVRVFSLGMGRRLIGFEHGGTDYRLSLLPFGGYVLMEGADTFQDGGDGAVDPDSPTAFMNKPVWQRLLVVAAGPVFNLGLPVVVFTALYMAGEPQEGSVVGQVNAQSAAEKAGIKAGDKLLTINGAPVELWADVAEAVGVIPPGKSAELVVERAGQKIPLTLQFPADLTLYEGQVWVGDLGLEYAAADNVVGVADPNSPAFKAGLRSFDRITAVDGQAVGNWLELSAALHDGAALTVTRLDAEGETEARELRLQSAEWTPSLAQDAHANPWGLAPASLFVGGVVEDAPAEAANIRVGDRLVAVDGQQVATWSDIVRTIGAKIEGEGESAKGVPTRVTLVREGRVLDISITPEVQQTTDSMARYVTRPIIGIEPGGYSVSASKARRFYSFPDAFTRATKETAWSARFIVESVGRMLVGEQDFSKSTGGVIQIGRDAAKAAEEGIFAWARMMAALSVSLGIVNFLPVPVLDGGQILFYSLEGIRGRPLSQAMRERAQQVGVLFLVGLMFVVLVDDVRGWITEKDKVPAAQVSD